VKVDCLATRGRSVCSSPVAHYQNALNSI